jgi:hypothetical protein
VLAVLGKGFVEDRSALQLLGRDAHQAAQPRVDAQQDAVGVDLGDADAGVLVGGGEPLVLLVQQRLRGVECRSHGSS